MDPQRKQVFYCASASRVGFLILSCLSNLIIPDISSDAFKSAAYNEMNIEKDGIVWKLFGGLLHWDAHHYLHIAQFGYTYENNLAFFPLYPIVVRVLGFTFNELLQLIKDKLAALLLGAVIFNSFIFVKSALILYDLTLYLFNDTHFSYTTAILFCFSPASVFFIAPYTEAFFSYCAFKGMLDFSRRKTYWSLFWFFLSVCLRSNGITFAGFMIHTWGYYCIAQFSWNSIKNNLRLTVQFTLRALQYVAVICFPYVAFQTYCYLQFCINKSNEIRTHILEHAYRYNLSMPSDHISWCAQGFVFPYFAIQEKLWDVGFLKYYQLKQVPNFLLALPVAYLIIYNGTKFLIRNYDMFFNPKRVYSYRVFMASVNKTTNEFPPSVFLYFVHILFVTIWGLLHINVQVLTRLIASTSPVLYWIGALKFANLPPSDEEPTCKCFFPFEKGKKLTDSAKFIKCYFIGYAAVGVILFSNNFPWT